MPLEVAPAGGHSADPGPHSYVGRQQPQRLCPGGALIRKDAVPTPAVMCCRSFQFCLKVGNGPGA